MLYIATLVSAGFTFKLPLLYYKVVTSLLTKLWSDSDNLESS